MPSPKNKAIIAAAGARKTQTIIDEALADPDKRVLITTYTLENQLQLERRLAAQAGGVMPGNITVVGWFGFLLRDGVRPYQVDMFGEPGKVGGLNFVGKKFIYTANSSPAAYIDHNNDVYRDSAAHLVCRINEKSSGLPITRLEAMYDHIYIDEVQDLVGYDLEVLDLLFASSIFVTVVGDPRQHTFGTNDNRKNTKYRGPGLLDWFDERSGVCAREDRQKSHRCNQEICDFASALFPDMPAMESELDVRTEHHGIIYVKEDEVLEYYERWQPQVLRWSITSKTHGLPGMNFGVAKGSTFGRVLIFPTKPMTKYLSDGDLEPLKSREKFYVAVTRARHSVAFVVK